MKQHFIKNRPLQSEFFECEWMAKSESIWNSEKHLMESPT